MEIIRRVQPATMTTQGKHKSDRSWIVTQSIRCAELLNLAVSGLARRYATILGK